MERLLFITERFPPDIGGLASSANRIATTLCELGFTVDVITWSRFLQPGDVLPPECDRPINQRLPGIYRIGLYRHWDMTLPHTLNLLDWLNQAHPYSAVWGHYLFPAGFLATWFAETRSLPSVVSVRGNDFDRALFPPGDFARLQWTLERASFITTVSQAMARQVSVLSQRQDITVLSNVVNSAIFSPTISQDDRSQLRASLGIAADEIVLGFSGELREKKGQQFLFQALSTVQSHYSACLLIIGEVRASEQTVLQSFNQQHSEAAQRVIVTGHLANQAEVARYLCLCDVYLQPSLWEGLPNALLEAMACGCCCIASDAGGIPEVIEHGKTGFLLPRSQLHQLGTAILECLELPTTERDRLGKAASEFVRSQQSLAQEQQQLQQLMARAINPKSL